MTQDSQPWSDHWRRTLTGSIDLQAADPVAQALRDRWALRTDPLQACEQIVDVGSGPAILARLMERLGWPLRAPLIWWCIDHAELGTGWQHALPSGVRVRDQTRFEAARPLEGPVDAVVSNFGLEYLGLEAVMQAMPRWVKPQGHLEAVVHAKGSVIDSASAEHVADLQLALEELQLPQLGVELAGAMATAPADPVARMMHGVEVRDAYNAAVDRLKQVMDTRGRPSPVLMDLLHGITNTLRQVGPLGQAAAAERIQAQGTAYGWELARLRQMQASALDEAQAQAWREGLAAALPTLRPVHLSPVECSLGLVAWNLSTAA